jgi:hypothetical protein
LLASTTSLLKELRETMPKVSEMLLALGAVIAAVAMIWSPAPEPGLPRAPAPSSARSIAP